MRRAAPRQWSYLHPGVALRVGLEQRTDLWQIRQHDARVRVRRSDREPRCARARAKLHHHGLWPKTDPRIEFIRVGAAANVKHHCVGCFPAASFPVGGTRSRNDGERGLYQTLPAIPNFAMALS